MQLTEDHSVVWELVKSGGLTRDQAQVHPYRNLLTRALGTSPEVEVDTLRLRLQPEDGLLLCSDGLTSVLADAEIHDKLNRPLPIARGHRRHRGPRSQECAAPQTTAYGRSWALVGGAKW